MPAPEFHTVNLQGWLDRLQAGDREARDELLRACQGRLLELAGRMLRRHPAVARWADTADVFQNAALRLLRALENTPVADTREYFNLAASVIRKELIDLARHYYGPHGWGANYESNLHRLDSEGRVTPFREPAAPGEPIEELERWTAFHEAIAQLPPEEREVFGLTYYHGWGQKEIAELIQKDERTVRRRWRSAVMHLNGLLKGQFPPGHVRRR